jgi:hypothetical protein
MNRLKAIAIIALAVLAVVGGGCVRGYTVKITNLLATTVVIEFAQYHAEDFGGIRPQDFTTDLLIGTRQVQVAPGEKSEVLFTDGSGGFWVIWRQLDPAVPGPSSGTLDLIRDKLTIVIEPTVQDGD